MKSKLIIFYHPNFSDGGVERTNLILGKGLVESGCHVIFLTTSYTQHFYDEAISYGIKIESLGAGAVSFKFFSFIKTVMRYSREYALVYIVSCQYYVNVFTMLAALVIRPLIKNIKFINSERNHIDEYTFRPGFKSLIILMAVKHLYRFSDVVVANSEETATDLERFTGKSVVTVYNPTINGRIDFLKQEIISEAWYLNDARPCILAIGRLSFQKDFETLIKAFVEVRRNIDVRLVILGEGDKRRELEKLIATEGLEKDVYLPGFVPNPYKFLIVANVFVLSSKFEGLPNVLIEAAYLNVPCVSTNCKSGPKEILLDGKAGLLVDVGDSEAMANAIIEVFADPEATSIRLKLAKMGTDRFCESDVVKKFELVVQ